MFKYLHKKHGTTIYWGCICFCWGFILGSFLNSDSLKSFWSGFKGEQEVNVKIICKNGDKACFSDVVKKIQKHLEE